MLVYPNLLIFFKFGKYDVKRKKNEEKLLDFKFKIVCCEFGK